MSTRLVLIAHAATAATRRVVFGAEDSLEARGLDAARARVIDPMPSRAWTSPSPAPRETAAAMGLDARPDDSLRDIDFGRWRGCAFAAIAEAEPDAVAAWMSDPKSTVHGGESIEALVSRVDAWLSGRLGDKGLSIAVTHAAVVRAAVLAALGAPGAAFWRIDVAPLGVFTLVTNGRRWALRAPSAEATRIDPR